jgi:hypothetical protein
MSTRPPTLRQRIEARIARRRDDAFFTREFLDLGGERQVLRALLELTEAGKLIRRGYGAHARAEISPITNRPMLAGEGFGPLSRQALEKLKVLWEPTATEQGYKEGRGTEKKAAEPGCR